MNNDDVRRNVIDVTNKHNNRVLETNMDIIAEIRAHVWEQTELMSWLWCKTTVLVNYPLKEKYRTDTITI